MTNEHEQKILAELKKNFIYDLNNGVKSLLRKSAIDIKLKLSEILQTSDVNEIAEGRTFVEQSTNIMSQDFLNQLIETVEKY